MGRPQEHSLGGRRITTAYMSGRASSPGKKVCLCRCLFKSGLTPPTITPISALAGHRIKMRTYARGHSYLSAAGVDTGSGSNGTNAGGNNNAGRTTGTHAVIFCHCFSTFIFSSSYSSSFPIISFPTTTTTGGARKERAWRTGWDMRGRRQQRGTARRHSGD